MIAAIVQARIGSARLPGKVLMEIEGKPMLQRVVERLKECDYLDDIIVATTTQLRDNPIIDLVENLEVRNYRLTGEPSDVLSRIYCAATLYKADIIVRITSDCPLIDPKVVDKAIKYFLDNSFDYVFNTGPDRNKFTYPDGLDVEVFSFDVLEKAWDEVGEVNDKYAKEHVTAYIYNNPDKFRVAMLPCDTDFKNLKVSELHWSVDTEEDLKFVRRIYRKLGENFDLEELIDYLRKR